jgi:hypothetical protein
MAFIFHALGAIIIEITRGHLANALLHCLFGSGLILFFRIKLSEFLLPCACTLWQVIGFLVKMDLLDYCTRKYRRKIFWFKLTLEDKLQLVLSLLSYLIFLGKAFSSFHENYFSKLIITSHLTAFLYLFGKLEFLV